MRWHGREPNRQRSTAYRSAIASWIQLLLPAHLSQSMDDGSDSSDRDGDSNSTGGRDDEIALGSDLISATTTGSQPSNRPITSAPQTIDSADSDRDSDTPLKIAIRGNRRRGRSRGQGRERGRRSGKLPVAKIEASSVVAASGGRSIAVRNPGPPAAGVRTL